MTTIPRNVPFLLAYNEQGPGCRSFFGVRRNQGKPTIDFADVPWLTYGDLRIADFRNPLPQAAGDMFAVVSSRQGKGSRNADLTDEVWRLATGAGDMSTWDECTTLFHRGDMGIKPDKAVAKEFRKWWKDTMHPTKMTDWDGSRIPNSIYGDVHSMYDAATVDAVKTVIPNDLPTGRPWLITPAFDQFITAVAESEKAVAAKESADVPLSFTMTNPVKALARHEHICECGDYAVVGKGKAKYCRRCCPIELKPTADYGMAFGFRVHQGDKELYVAVYSDGDCNAITALITKEMWASRTSNMYDVSADHIDAAVFQVNENDAPNLLPTLLNAHGFDTSHSADGPTEWPKVVLPYEVWTGK